MDPERNEPEPTHEFRLEGIGLLLGGGLLLAAIVGSFLVGRWYERRSHPPATSGATESGVLEHVEEALPDATAEQGLTFFDEVAGDDRKELEPEREAAKTNVPPQVAAKPAAAEEADHPYWVQVFAGRDRALAEKQVKSLTEDGLTFRMLTEREGTGALYKVQVGGFPTREEADHAAEELRKAGYSVWVPPLD